MKTLPLALFALAMGSLASLQAQNVVENGDFETNYGSVGMSFEQTPNWYNWGTGLNQKSVARSRANPLAGSTLSAQINDRYNVLAATSVFDRAAFGAVVHSQKTGHVIRQGDSFQLSYSWITGAGWNRMLKEVRFVLFATEDNTLGGPVVWSEVLDSGIASAVEMWESVTLQSGPVNPAAAGRNLFVAFYGFQNNNDMTTNPGFARVDNIIITPVKSR